MVSSGQGGLTIPAEGEESTTPEAERGGKRLPSEARQSAGARKRPRGNGETTARRRPTEEGDRRRRKERRHGSEPIYAYKGERPRKREAYLVRNIFRTAPTSGGAEGTDAFTRRPTGGRARQKMASNTGLRGNIRRLMSCPAVLPKRATR